MLSLGSWGWLCRRLVELLWAPLAGLVVGLAVAVLASASPIRWDAKSLGAILPRAQSGTIESGADILFVSNDNTWVHGHVANYGLQLLTVPRGRRAWIAFRENVVDGPWSPTILLDQAGNFHPPLARDGSNPDARTLSRVLAIAQDGSVLVPSSETKSQLLQRWPTLAPDRIAVLAAGRPTILEWPRVRTGWRQLVRLVLVAIVFSGVAGAVWKMSRGLPLAERWFRVTLVPPCLLVLHMSLVFVLGKFTAEAIGLALAVAAAAGAVFWGVVVRSSPRPEGGRRGVTVRAHLAAALVIVLCVYLGVAIGRYDFDGDLFTHWLPMAGHYYVRGDHDVAALLVQYGMSHISTYPPGFPIVLSTLMWVGGMSREAPFQLGDAAHVTVLLYRLLLASLSLSFLMSIGTLFRRISRADGARWMLPVVAVPLSLPPLLGQPTSAEVYLVPLMGFSILALVAGATLAWAWYGWIGLWLAAGALLIKNEVVLMLPLIILPWYLAGHAGPWRAGAVARDATAVALGLLPFLAWRWELNYLGIHPYLGFQTMDPGQFFRHAVPVSAALKVLLASNQWVALLLLLPCAILYRGVRHWKATDALVPAGIVAYVVGMTCVYAFSRNDPVRHLETSFDRVLMVAVLSSIVYGAMSMMSGDCAGTEEHNKQRVPGTSR